MTPKEIYNILTKEIGEIPENEKEAQQWFKDSYLNGSKKIQKALLELLSYDVIRPQDSHEEIMWLFRELQHEKHFDFKKLRKMFYEGHGSDETRQGVVDFFNKKADNGHLDSIIFMGHIHTAGFNAEKSLDLAHKWYSKAAEKGDAGCQIAVADYHFNKEEYYKAIPWYEKAGSQGKKTAFIRLSQMYKKGLGVSVDEEKSISYKNKATAKPEITNKKITKIRPYHPKSKKNGKK